MILDLINYYLDFFIYRYVRFPLVIKIAVAITFVYITLNLILFISFLLRRIRSNRKKVFKINKKGEHYGRLKRIALSDEIYSFTYLSNNLSKFHKNYKEAPNLIIEILVEIKNESNQIDSSKKLNYDNIRHVTQIFSLDKYWETKLSKGNYREKMKSLEEIIDLGASISESILSTLVYHKNNELRKKARIAQIHFSQHAPFKFFSEDFDKDFTEWDKIKIHDILLKRPKNLIPNFARWIPTVKNEDLQCLFIFEIGYFLQDENRHFLYSHFKNSISDKVKIECLKTLELLGITDFKEKLLNLYPICSEAVQLQIAVSLQHEARHASTLKFFLAAFDKTYEPNLKVALGKVIYSSGELGERAIAVVERKAEGFEKLVFEHVKNPLLNN